MSKRFADVAPFVPLNFAKPQTFTYRLPTARKPIKPYQLVEIPWRRRTAAGVVMAVRSQAPPFKTKSLTPLDLPPLTSEQVKFAHWISETMQGGLGYTLRLFAPPSPFPMGRRGRVRQALILTAEQWRADELFNHLPSRQRSRAVVVHTNHTKKQLARAWHSVYSGRVKTIIGTQKALFLPFTQLKEITLDQEQLPTHKLWDQYPHLHNFYAANALADIYNCPVICAGDVPSLRLIHLAKKETQKKHLPLKVITPAWSDRQQKYPLPVELIEAIRGWQRKKQSSLLFVNEDTKPIKHFLKKVMPQTEVVRLTAVEKQPAEQTHAVTVATSAVFTAVPHTSFDHIVFLYPERSLSYPDYRSEERVYYLLRRLMSKLKKSQTPLHIVTKHPRLVEDKLLEGTSLMPLKSFSAKQIKARRKFHYPPAADLVLLTVQEKQKGRALKNALAIKKQLEQRIRREEVQLRGPFQSFVETKPSLHAYHLLLSGSFDQLTPLYKNLPLDRVDLDPYRIL